MFAHVYHEGVARKGANNVASLIMKTLKKENVIREDEIGGELVIVFDNCSGQNKNNTLLKLLVYLVECGYFKDVWFVFLIVGHTKNAADRLFNLLKIRYRQKNIYTMPVLLEQLGDSDFVTIDPSAEPDFNDWDSFLNNFYATFSGKVKKNHIFHVNRDTMRKENQVRVELRESNLDHDKISYHRAIKQGFETRKNYPTGGKGLKLAVNNRGTDIRAARSTLLHQIEAPGMNVYKQVEMFKNYRPLVPPEFQGDSVYAEPDEMIVNAVKEEKVTRKRNMDDIKATTRQLKRKLKNKLDTMV